MHGRRSRRGRGGQVPPELGVGGTLVQIVPLRFLSYRYKKERSVAFKIAKIRFRPGLCLGPRYGSSRRSARPPSRLERGHPSPYPVPFGTDPPSALAMRPPQNSSQIYAYDRMSIVAMCNCFGYNALHCHTRYSSRLGCRSEIYGEVIIFWSIEDAGKEATRLRSYISSMSSCC